MKRLIKVYSFILWFPFLGFSQIANYNQFPTKNPTHVLDEKLNNISFALGMRILESDYEGPLLRLRRASDNSTQDFYAGDDDIVDIVAINTWRAGATVFMNIWYDQSGLNRDAIQNTLNKQPQFIPDPMNPYFQGDAANDELIVGTSIQILTNAGANGSVIAVLSATRRNQHTFGVLVGLNRWSAHMNWGENNLYFDPGICCNTLRSFENSANTGVWNQYTFLRGTTTVTARQRAVQKFTGTHTTGRCTRNLNFAIGHATGTGGGYSDTKIAEMIMYNTDIATNIFTEIEENQIEFWNL